MCLQVRELSLCDSGVFVIKGDIAVEDSHLEVRVCGPGNTEMVWKWGGQDERIRFGAPNRAAGEE